MFNNNGNFNNGNDGQRKNDSAGAIWCSQSKNGNQYLSISIDGVGNFIAFKNQYKRADNQPDFRIFRKDQLNNQNNNQSQSPMRKQTFNNNNYQNNYNQQQQNNNQQMWQQQNQYNQNQMQGNQQQNNNFDTASDDEFKDLNLF